MLAAFNPAVLVLPVLGVIVIVLLIRAARAHARKVRDQMHAFAARAGLQVREQTMLGFTSVERLEGEQSGRRIRYWTYSTGSGKSRITWIAAGVTPRATAGLEFELTRQNFGSKLLEMFGAREIQVGDPGFDRAWFVRTNQPDFFAAALVPSIRARLMAEGAGRRGARYKLEGGVVHYAEQGRFSGTEALERLERQMPVLHELADVAEVFAEGRR